MVTEASPIRLVVHRCRPPPWRHGVTARQRTAPNVPPDMGMICLRLSCPGAGRGNTMCKGNYKMYDATGWYSDVLKADQLATAHALGLMPGKQAMTVAMSLRVEGVTAPQILHVCGAPQLNRMRGLERDLKYTTRVPMPQNGMRHQVYHYALTKKGEHKVALTNKRLAEAEAAGNMVEVAKPAKSAKPKAKATKPKATARKRLGKLTDKFKQGEADQPPANTENSPTAPADAPEGIQQPMGEPMLDVQPQQGE
jgi:hypothetical protein